MTLSLIRKIVQADIVPADARGDQDQAVEGGLRPAAGQEEERLQAPPVRVERAVQPGRGWGEGRAGAARPAHLQVGKEEEEPLQVSLLHQPLIRHCNQFSFLLIYLISHKAFTHVPFSLNCGHDLKDK